MSRDTRLGRPRPEPSGATTGTDAVSQPLVSLLAQTTGPSDLWPALHQHALDITGGMCSLLFQHNPRNGLLHATSGFGLETLRTDPWVAAPDEAAVVAGAFERGMATLVPDADRQMPDLALRLGTTALLLVPLARGPERVGLLAVGFASAPEPSRLMADATPVADAFTVSLEVFRLRQRDQLQRDLVTLLDEFSTSLTTTLTLGTGLEILC